MKLIAKILILIIFLETFAVARRLKFKTYRRRVRDDIDLPVIAHAIAYDTTHNNKSHEKFFSTFEHIYEDETLKKFKVSVGVTNDPLPGETDAAGVKPRAVIVVFRGTANWDNVLSDIQYSQVTLGGLTACKGCEIHGGFSAAYLKLKSKLIQKLKDVLSKYATHRGIKIKHVIFTGHSLGGALANLGAYNFCNRRSHARSSPNEETKMFDVDNVSLITFGAPRVGNASFKNFLDEEAGLKYNYRIIYAADPVTGAPPKKIGEMTGSTKFEFVHAGTEIKYNKNDFNTPNLGNKNEDTCTNDTLNFWNTINAIFDASDHSQYKHINYKALWEKVVGHEVNFITRHSQPGKSDGDQGDV